MKNINLYGLRNGFDLIQAVFEDFAVSFSVMLAACKYAVSRRDSEMVPMYNASLNDQIKQYTRLKSLKISDLPENHPLLYVFENTLITRIDYRERYQSTYEPDLVELFFIIDDGDPKVESVMPVNHTYTIHIRHVGNRMSRNIKPNYETHIISGDHTVDETDSGVPMEMTDSFLELISRANDRLSNLNLIYNKCKDLVRFPDEKAAGDYNFLRAYFAENGSGKKPRIFFYEGFRQFAAEFQPTIKKLIQDSKQINKLLSKHPYGADGVPDSKKFAREIVDYLKLNDIYLSHWDVMIRNAIRDSFTDDQKLELDRDILDKFDSI